MATAAAAAGAGAGADAPSVCGLCGEVEPTGGCAGGHSLCCACVAAVVRATEKVLGPTEIPPLCPLDGCTEFIRAPAATRAGSRRHARLVRLEPDDPERADVAAAFAATMGKAKVRNIYRVENPALRAMYETCRERLEKERRKRGPCERRLFHATTRAAAGGIVREGFDAHRAGQAHGKALGAGIYAADEASFSDNYSREDSVGMRAMFACQVLLGEAGRHSQSRDGQHVVYREQQILPTHLIHYDA